MRGSRNHKYGFTFQRTFDQPHGHVLEIAAPFLRSISRTISPVVALPCSMSEDHGPPACSVARNRLPSGMKMAVIAGSLGRFLERDPEQPG
jgi:hypothetical protein